MLSAWKIQISAVPATAYTAYAGGSPATGIAASSASPPTSVQVSDATELIRVISSSATNSGTISSAISGARTSRAPQPVATPRPPWSPMYGERLWPMTAAMPASEWTSGSVPRMIARSTAAEPFAASRKPAASAARNPSARMTFAPPVRPLPRLRGSGPPTSRATTIPHGIPPMK